MASRDAIITPAEVRAIEQRVHWLDRAVGRLDCPLGPVHVHLAIGWRQASKLIVSARVIQPN